MMKTCPWICIVFHIILSFNLPTNGENILVFAPLPIKSHFGGFQALFRELAFRGYNVTVISFFPLDKPIKNYNEIVIPFNKSFETTIPPMIMTGRHFLTVIPLSWYFTVKRAYNVLSSTVLQEFIQNDDSKFDLVLVFTFGQSYCVTLGHKYNAPIINLNVLMLWQSNSKWIGEPSTYSYIPDARAGVTPKMSFTERIKNSIIGFLQLYPEDFIHLPKYKDIMDTFFKYPGWETRPSMEDMLKNVSLTLVNAHFSVGITRPYLPGTVEVGGLHIKEAKQLSGKFLEFIESAEHGVIYFSFGTIVNPVLLPKEKIQVFVNVFKKLKQKIMWKWKGEIPFNLSDNVMLREWYPQEDILGHTNIKLFITHGGLHSLEEASYNAKPLIGIPFFGDQHMNMRIVEEKGFGKMIDIQTINEESLLSSIIEVLENPKFKENSIRQSSLYKDQEMKPIDRAVYWVEYVIRHKGASHLKSKSVELNSIQYFLIDILVVFLISVAIILVTIYIVFITLKYTFIFKTKND
ncbi:UDP-glycosyltransferase UGT4-like isoform X1 [Daktulosphaira vitifoliae]|uniref:UDP-glycosyltransferase UGT4-like isoform X1 n=1 Tax=Daktulosphaira vitifoliae TaxID=58002 RepID=UPI0021A9A83A|nr:UDP-glycosyltransferase UGT4-like isoform X1 [Daktulosphaira vitifoliae]